MAQESGTLSLESFYLERSEPIRFTCDMRLKPSLQLKGHYQSTPTLENKNLPILRSQNTQKTRTPSETGSEHSVSVTFLLDSGTLIHFRWINLKLSLPQHNNYKTQSRKLNWVLTNQHTQELE